MKNETIYEPLKGKYVRVIMPNGQGVGLLKSIDYTNLILSPFIQGMGTDIYTRFIISNGIWIIPYEDVKGGVQEIEDGKRYMQQYVDDAEIKNKKDIQFLLAEMKSKGIEDKSLETKIKVVLER